MQSDHPGVQVAAAHVVARGERGSFGATLERLLRHADREVREAALIGALAFGLPNAWSACEAWALDPELDAPELTSLSAALGGPGHHARLAKLLDHPRRKRSALIALGYSGDPARVPQLIELTASSDRLEAKLAARAVSLITGLDLNDETYAHDEEPDEEAETLPELEDDDLDADLVPPLTAAGPAPNPPAIAAFWERDGARFELRQRYLAGQRFSLETVLDFLEHGALGSRHTVALALGIRTGGAAWVDTRARSSNQRARLAVLRASEPRSFTNYFDR